MTPWLLLYPAAGFAAGFLSLAVFNRVPARWLCDYGETPAPELLGKRLSPAPDGIALGFVFSAAFLLLGFQYHAPNAAFFLLCAALLPLTSAAVSDLKYHIIPDQCLPAALLPAAVLYALTLCGRADFYSSAFSPFLGALAGGGLWLVIGLIGKLIYRRESIGFGDVKIFAVIGFLCGFPNVLAVFLIGILLAGIHFIVLLLMHKIKPDQYMPMGPYLCAACLLELAFQSQIAAGIQWYISRLH